MLEGIENLILADRPDMVVIYGDTNSTVAGALAASKLHVPVAHVESGLRSFNRAMPEELNRIVADHVSDLLLAPTETAMVNLRKEALGDRAVWTGDVMYDAVLFNRDVARRRSTIVRELELRERGFGVVTLHRAENTDDGSRLAAILSALAEIASASLPLVFPIHPRTRAAIDREMPGWVAPAALQLVEPVGYLDMLRFIDAARLVLTDSGGLQKEAFFLGRPCVTLRDETEWLETVSLGGNVLVGADGRRIQDAVIKILEGSGDVALEAAASEAFGDGHSARRIVEAIEEFLGH
jgi:UDP-GlcNAc3NAcA epimerase